MNESGVARALKRDKWTRTITITVALGSFAVAGVFRIAQACGAHGKWVTRWQEYAVIEFVAFSWMYAFHMRNLCRRLINELEAAEAREALRLDKTE